MVELLVLDQPNSENNLPSIVTQSIPIQRISSPDTFVYQHQMAPPTQNQHLLIVCSHNPTNVPVRISLHSQNLTHHYRRSLCDTKRLTKWKQKNNFVNSLSASDCVAKVYVLLPSDRNQTTLYPLPIDEPSRRLSELIGKLPECKPLWNVLGWNRYHSCRSRL